MQSTDASATPNIHQQVNHGLAHPNVHYAASAWSEAQTLHVAAAYSNPDRWATRRQTFNDFRRRMADAPNVVLHVAELAYGDRPFEATSRDCPLDIQLRTSTQLWHKENLLNLAVARFPADWRYGAYVDADWAFTRHDWALETIHLLQHYDWLQMFSSYTDLGPDHRPNSVIPSFAYNWMAKRSTPRSYASGSPGGAWAFRRSAFEAVGGFMDFCILGAGDWYMACGLAGVTNDHRAETIQCGQAYRDAIAAWQKRAATLTGNISYLPDHSIHHFHGSKGMRAYESRWQILREYDFNPQTDIYRDWQGVLQLSPDKRGLRDALRRYFALRNEDNPTLFTERPLV
jgi:hypothetical protein